MINYQRNNILFRIASADAISRFKEAQAHSFLQLSRKELNFNEAAKEVVLLEYDRFSQLIFKIERICLSAGEGAIKSSLVHSIMDSFFDELHVIETVLESHSDIFTTDVIDFTKLIHTYSSDMLRNGLPELMRGSIEQAYTRYVAITSDYLQHLLISMHEFDSNIVKKIEHPFISIADFCVDFLEIEHNFIPCTTRAVYFEKNGIGKTYILKNYSKRDIFNEAYNVLTKYGITLIPEEMNS